MPMLTYPLESIFLAFLYFHVLCGSDETVRKPSDMYPKYNVLAQIYVKRTETDVTCFKKVDMFVYFFIKGNILLLMPTVPVQPICSCLHNQNDRCVSSGF